MMLADLIFAEACKRLERKLGRKLKWWEEVKVFFGKDIEGHSAWYDR